ncbi:hypothetical protein TUN199_07054 [Pyrenophora tritici-repentis]|nr:hypothetical protein Alg130_08429 [Pyrenophora tritici-repentis]KAI0620939.1 hypothetical protein TUN199_07054 [Pyrenophora tritici-repentis]
MPQQFRFPPIFAVLGNTENLDLATSRLSNPSFGRKQCVSMIAQM